MPPRKVIFALVILLILIFSKYFYLASLSNYYTFYLIEHFGVSVQNAQIHLFVFLGAVAAGTLIGGPVGDRYGRKLVILTSIFGVLPFTLMLPHANLFWTGPLYLHHRLHPVVGLLGDSGLRTGTHSRPHRHGLRIVLRLRLRHGRHRRRGPGPPGRFPRHLHRLQALRLAPCVGTVRHPSAASAARILTLILTVPFRN